MLLETKNQPNLILYVTKIDDNPHHFNKLFKLRDEIEQLPQDWLNIKVDFQAKTAPTLDVRMLDPFASVPYDHLVLGIGH
ncbi:MULTISPECIES: hypothetical protein [unclassified Nostoc]|uniref:hypothetical protein n=1 Tax=unclassified Nostoc TaxID=2593658 RepID=UPI00262410B6|nr:hypothetical protein [Nostoc sp. S13]MDF5734496.1 hypothetical protein [Nostoc sp. S13]